MSARRPGGSWFHQNYDKLALVVVLVLLLASAMLLAFRVTSDRRSIAAAAWDRPIEDGAGVPALDTARLERVAKAVTTPLQMPADAANFLVGELRVASVPDGSPIPYDALTDPFTGTAQPPIDEKGRDIDGDGLPDEWEARHGLNPQNALDAAADADNDGFSNAEEFLAKTDPTDATSRPDVSAKLRLMRTRVDLFPIRFQGVSQFADGDRYQLNVPSEDRTIFAKMGEVVKGYTLAAFEPAQPGRKPALLLKQGEKTKRLVKDAVVQDDSYSALLVSLIERTPFAVRKDQEFTLADQTYKVVDIKRDHVIIRNSQSGKETHLNQLTAEEIQILQSRPESAPAGAPGGGGAPDDFVGFE